MQDKRQSGYRLWQMLIAAAVITLLYGINHGDVSDAEATVLLQADALLSPETAGEPDRETATGFARLIAGMHSWSGRTTIESARIICFAAVVLMVTLIDGTLRRRVGIRAGAAGGLTALCSAPALFLSHRLGVDSILGLALVGVVVMSTQLYLCQSVRIKSAAGVMLLAFLALGAFVLQGVDPIGSFGRRYETSIALFWTVACSAPASFGLLLAFRPDFWRSLSREERTHLVAGIALAALGLAATIVMPARWMAGSIAVVCGSALIAGVAWQRWLSEDLAEAVAKLQLRIVRAAAFGTAALLAALGTARIFSTYNLMERVQAVVIVAVVTFTLAAWILRQRAFIAAWIPVLGLLIICKFAYVHIWLLERDHWESPRAAARAVRDRLPEGARLLTQMPVSDAYRYYVQTPVGPIEQADVEAETTAPRFALVAESDLSGESGRLQDWRLLRYFEGAAHQRWMLLEEPAGDVVQTGGEGGPFPSRLGMQIRPARQR